MNNLLKYLGKRIVITYSNNVSYAGIAKEIIEIENKRGLLVELDKKSGFSIWCPIEFIQGIILVPIE